jgi:hypothetical protein
MSSRWQPTPMAAAASSFSTELVPGKGFGKTSTGIVRRFFLISFGIFFAWRKTFI